MQSRDDRPLAGAAPAAGSPSFGAAADAAARLVTDMHARGARVLSVFGNSPRRVLVEMPIDLAEELFAQPLDTAARTDVVDAAERDIEAIRERDEHLGSGALAASVVALAYELQDPFNSATSKSMCARALVDAWDRIRELAPPKKETDGVDDLHAQRDKRRRDALRRAVAAD